MDDLSNRLAFLRDDIINNIEIARQHDTAGNAARFLWITGLAEAREHFQNNKTFGLWFEASGIKLGKTDRAAAIAMGKHPEQLKAVLSETKSRSIEMIYRQHFRLPNNRNSGGASAAKKPKATPIRDKAAHAIERRAQAGEPIGRDAVAEEAGVSHGIADAALAAHKARSKSIDPEGIFLSTSAQKRFDAKLRAYQKRLDLEVETKVLTEVKKRIDEWYIPDYMKLLREVQKMLEWKRGVMTRKEYNKVMRCLHPDTGGHASDEARNEAFRLFTEHEAKLVDDAEEARLKRVSTLPQTVEELLARRRTKR